MQSDHPIPSLVEMLEAASRTARDLGGRVAPPRSLRVQLGEASVHLEWPSPEVAAADGGAARHPAAPEVAAAEDHIVAPTLGTFYRAPEPGAEPFVEEGQTVTVGQQVGVVEAMKMLVPIEATRTGRIEAVLVKDAEPVQYGEPLFAFTPLDE